MFHFYRFAIFISLLATPSVWAEDAEKKAPVPNDAAQAESMKLLKDIYGGELAAAKTADQKKALAKKLLEKAASTQDDLASKYVLLKAGKSVAVQAMDAETAFEAVETMGGSFQVDVLALKTEVLDSLARRTQAAAEHVSIAGLALGLMDQTLAAERFEMTVQLGNMALDEARKARSPKLLRQAQASLADVKRKAKAFEEEKAALAVLDKKVDDPQANLAVGKYLCFDKGDWEKGLPKLALGNDDDLRALALAELAGPSSAIEQVKVGDSWWALAEKQTGAGKSQIEERADYWYQKALPGLTGLMKDKIEKRLAQATAAPSPKADSGPARRGPPLAIAPFNEKTAKQHQARWARYLGVPVVHTNSIRMKLVLIPPGEFQMGSRKELTEEELRLHDGVGWYPKHPPGEGLQHRVRITKPFWLGATDVTQEEYQRVIGSNPSKFQGDPQGPVEQVSWDDAVEFCHKLSALPAEKAAKRRYGLPTEAQWEYACRAGTTTRWYSGDNVAGLVDVAWFDKNAGGHTHSVGQKGVNAWGLYDMHGNVWEWCQDLYDNEYYAKSPTDDPAGPPGGSARVFRGGGWIDGAGYCWSAYRNGIRPGLRDCILGFRVALVSAE